MVGSNSEERSPRTGRACCRKAVQSTKLAPKTTEGSGLVSTAAKGEAMDAVVSVAVTKVAVEEFGEGGGPADCGNGKGQ